jgi:hypothetical protein
MTLKTASLASFIIIALASVAYTALFISYQHFPFVGLLAFSYVAISFWLLQYSSSVLGFVSFSTVSIVFYVWFLGLFPVLRSAFEDVDRFDAAQHELSYWVAISGIVSLGIGLWLGRHLIPRVGTQPLLVSWGFDIFDSWRVNAVLQLVALAAYVYSVQSGYFFLGVETEGLGGFAGGAAVAAGWMTIAYVAAINHAVDGKDHVLVWRLLALCSFICLSIFGALSLSKYSLFLPLGVLLLTLAQHGAWGKTLLILFSVIVLYAASAPIIEALRIFLGGAGAARAVIGGEFSFDIADLGASSLIYAEAGRIVEALGRGLFDYYAFLVNNAGQTFPYFDGFTYTYGMRSLVPLLDKGDTLGFLIARVTGYLPWTDSLTNLSPTNIGEHYLNFGVYGVALGMLITGVFYVWLDRRLTVPGHWTAVYLLLFINFNESTIGQSWFPLLKNLAISFLVFVPLALIVRFIKRARVDDGRATVPLPVS